MGEPVYEAIKERRLPCLSLMKGSLKVHVFLYLPVTFELVPLTWPKIEALGFESLMFGTKPR